MAYVIGILTLIVALNGILFQPKKNIRKPLSLKNLNKFGFVLIGVLLILTSVTIYQQVNDKLDNKKLQERNEYILKAMNFCNGYDLLVSGTIQFKKSESEKHIRTSLKNLFIKEAKVQLVTHNNLGNFEGEVNAYKNVEINKFWNLRREGSSAKNTNRFELKFEDVKILNKESIPYVKLSNEDKIEAIQKKKTTSKIYKNI